MTPPSPESLALVGMAGVLLYDAVHWMRARRRAPTASDGRPTH